MRKGAEEEGGDGGGGGDPQGLRLFWRRECHPLDPAYEDTVRID